MRITLVDGCAIAIRNLRAARVRSLLTIVGMSIGVASFGVMTSLGLGLEREVKERFIRSGLFDTVTVLSAESIGAGALGTPLMHLDDEAIAELSKLAHVTEVYPEVRLSVKLRYGSHSTSTVAAGVPLSARDRPAFKAVAHGRFFESVSEAECMLSLDTAMRLSPQPAELIGRTIVLAYMAVQRPVTTSVPNAGTINLQPAEHPCEVVGIVRKEVGPSIGGVAVSPVMLPVAVAERLYSTAATDLEHSWALGGERNTYKTVIVRVDQPQNTQDVQSRIKGIGFRSFSVNDALEDAKQTFLIVELAFALIGSLALAVSALGVGNTAVTWVVERRNEIGIMKAVGARRSDIRRTFLVEAAIIGVSGGIVGMALALLVSHVINVGVNGYLNAQGAVSVQVFYLPMWLMVGSIFLSTVVSVVAGTWPAVRASRFAPVEIIRHE